MDFSGTDPGIEECWEDLRRGLPKRRPSAFADLTAAPLLEWAGRSEGVIRVVPGDNRATIFSEFEEGLPSGMVFKWPNPWGGHVTRGFTHLVRDIFIPSGHRSRQGFVVPLPHPSRNPSGWDLLWGLSACNSPVIEEPLRGMTDRRVSRLGEVFRALTEIRFDIRERKDWQLIEDEVQALGRWMEGSQKITPFLSRVLIRRPLGEIEQLDAALFLLTLAKQNHLLDEVFVVVDDLQLASKTDADGLYQVVSAIKRWAIIGSPLRLLVGWDGVGSMRKIHLKLAQQLREGVTWAK